MPTRCLIQPTQQSSEMNIIGQRLFPLGGFLHNIKRIPDCVSYAVVTMSKRAQIYIRLCTHSNVMFIATAHLQGRVWWTLQFFLKIDFISVYTFCEETFI